MHTYVLYCSAHFRTKTLFIVSHKSDVSSSPLSSLLLPQPPQIGSLESLEELQLDSNQLKELPDDLGRLSNLLSIDVTKNKLEFLPTTVNHLFNLKDLHVSENLLTTVPDSIGVCVRACV